MRRRRAPRRSCGRRAASASATTAAGSTSATTTQRDLKPQLEALKPRVATLVALNQKYGTSSAYHTHSGAGNIGGNVWDIWKVIRGFDPWLVALNYDIGHATARGGDGWIDAAHVVSPYIRALAVKDFGGSVAAKGWLAHGMVPAGRGHGRFHAALRAAARRRIFPVRSTFIYEHSNLLGTDVGTWKLDMSRERFIAIVSKDLKFLSHACHETARGAGPMRRRRTSESGRGTATS